MTGDAFVAFHGSWNRNPPAGYRVARIPIDPQTHLPTGKVYDILFESNATNCNPCFRPVDLTFDSKGHLIVTADASSELIHVTYKERELDPDPTTTRTEPSTQPTQPTSSLGPSSA